MHILKRFPLLSRFLLLFALALPASLALAGGGEARFEQMAQAVGLSADQRMKASEILQNYQMAQIDSKAKVAKGRLELKHLIDAEVVDEKATYKALDVLMAAENESAHLRLKLMLDLRKVLTLEQWRQAELLRQQNRHSEEGMYEDDRDDRDE